MQKLPTAIWTLTRTTFEVLLAPPESTARVLAEANAAPQLRLRRAPAARSAPVRRPAGFGSAGGWAPGH